MMCSCNPDKSCYPYNTQKIYLFHSIYHSYLIQFFFTIHLLPPFIQFDTFTQKMYRTFILRSTQRASNRFFFLPFPPLVLSFLINQKFITPPVQICLQILYLNPTFQNTSSPTYPLSVYKVLLIRVLYGGAKGLY